jgi:heme oxygenase (biliverdin-IX-beta and delta-forming)
MSAIAALRSATWGSHQRLEKRLDVKSRFSQVGAYRSHLQQMWGFCAALEQSLTPQSFCGALPNYEMRRKLPLLTADLLALGVQMHSIQQLPRCAALPVPTDAAAAFGCAYVLEGATLGGRSLMPMVEARLGLSAERGAAFLASYRDNVTQMWRDFGTALDTWCSLPERQDSASGAAVKTFDALADWLCGAAA